MFRKVSFRIVHPEDSRKIETYIVSIVECAQLLRKFLLLVFSQMVNIDINKESR